MVVKTNWTQFCNTQHKKLTRWEHLEVEACLTVDVVLLRPPLKSCSLKTQRLKWVMRMNQFQMISLIYCQFAWKSNILNLNRKIIVLFDQRVDPTWLPHLAFKHTCFIHIIEIWSVTHSVSADWSDFCSTESWLFRYRCRDSTVLDVCSSCSLFWRSFPSSSQSELQNYQCGEMKTHPTFSQQFQLQTPCDVVPSHICN